jgi:Zn-dependent protease with chaperone function
VTDALFETTIGSYVWQTFLHSMVLGAVAHGWTQRGRVPPGRARRRLLAVGIVLPLLTAAVPGRSSDAFRESLAWFDGSRILAVPLPLGLHVVHLALFVMAAAATVTVWQEIVPSLRRRRPRGAPALPDLISEVRTFRHWHSIDVVVTPSASIELAAGGWWKPRYLVVSRGAIDRLSSSQLSAALAHEHAHCEPRRWWTLRVLFIARALQPHSPAALWAFREHCLGEEIACDREASTDRGVIALARTLLRVYQRTPRTDVAARAALRHRIDALVHPLPDSQSPSLAVVTFITVAMTLALPWLT